MVTSASTMVCFLEVKTPLSDQLDDFFARPI